MNDSSEFTTLELCAGAGGQALGVERAGFRHVGAIELDPWAVRTLERNRPAWEPQLGDVRDVNGAKYRGVTLLAGGVPCPPFSVAGKQLGPDDDRDLFPAAVEWISEAEPSAVMLENVPGLASPKFESYRERLFANLRSLGFSLVDGAVLNASEYGVCQLRPRFIIIALRDPFAEYFSWPALRPCEHTVGNLLFDLMAERGWKGAPAWSKRANRVAPTLVGGSKLHGGPDLGPTRAKQAWRQLGVDGSGLADAAPGEELSPIHHPKLTVRMTARIQGFPDDWQFEGRKTAAYRQVGNAFPPPVAEAVAGAIRAALLKRPLDAQTAPTLFSAVG